MTERSDLAALVESFSRARVLCIGDVMLDRFVYGEVERISALVKDKMESAASLRVPLVVEVGVGDNWFDAKH